jgi:hypothetical protein
LDQCVCNVGLISKQEALTPGGAPIANVHPKIQTRRSRRCYFVDAERVGW